MRTLSVADARSHSLQLNCSLTEMGRYHAEMTSVIVCADSQPCKGLTMGLTARSPLLLRNLPFKATMTSMGTDRWTAEQLVSLWTQVLG